MSTLAPLLTAADLARFLRRTVPWVHRHHALLVDQHGFPPPLPGLGGLRWDPAAVEAWLVRLRGGNSHQAETEDLRQWRARLSRRLDEAPPPAA